MTKHVPGVAVERGDTDPAPRNGDPNGNDPENVLGKNASDPKKTATARGETTNDESTTGITTSMIGNGNTTGTMSDAVKEKETAPLIITANFYLSLYNIYKMILPS